MKPLVSIVCNAYNQEDYIEETILSFINQKADFDFEILIHDDASTDRTQKIIKEYCQKYPNLIFPILQVENQYSKGVSILRDIQIPRAKGKYIALCEGDDYWIDEYKLQKQVQLLETKEDIKMCSHGALEVIGVEKRYYGKTLPTKKNSLLSPQDVIFGGGAFLATNSLLFKKELFESPPAFFNFMPLDYTLQIMGSLDNGIAFIPSIMSAHRVAANNSWTSRMKANPQSKIAFNEKLCQMLSILDDDTDGKYTQEIKTVIGRYQVENEICNGNYKGIKEKYPEEYKKLPRKFKMSINLHLYAPFVFSIRELLYSKH